MRKCVISLFALIITMFVLASCSQSEEQGDKNSDEDGDEVQYEMITAEQAKNIMESETGYIILDVRTDEEFAESRIAGAILIPYDEIESRAENELKDKSQLILVYCRSGRRSKIAAQELVELGYTNVKEFGGIIDWSYGTVS